LSPNGDTYNNTHRSRRRFAWDDGWVFLDIEGVTCRLNSVDNLHTLTRSYAWTTSTRWRVLITHQQLFLYKYQNTANPTRNLQNNWSAKDTSTSKVKSICFKIQGYFGNLVVLKKENTEKPLSQSKLKVCFQWFLGFYTVQSKEIKAHMPLINSTIPNISRVKV
jgi:hypothetical protein